jgi:hypothetical protein
MAGRTGLKERLVLNVFGTKSAVNPRVHQPNWQRMSFLTGLMSRNAFRQSPYCLEKLGIYGPPAPGTQIARIQRTYLALKEPVKRTTPNETNHPRRPVSDVADAGITHEE